MISIGKFDDGLLWCVELENTGSAQSMKLKRSQDKENR